MDIGAVESPHAAPPPRVTAVYVSGASWATPVKSYLQSRGLGDEAFGYAVPAGAEQLRVLPWLGVNRVSARFSQDVTGHLADLAVTGVNTASYAVSDYVYDAATRTATWTLAQPLRNDRVTLTLGAGPGGVSGASGRLDGEWVEGTGAFPSGNGAAGGDLVFRLRALPADADRSGRVNALDLAVVKRSLGTRATDTATGLRAYDVFSDVTADGRIDALDVAGVKRNLTLALPAGEPEPAPAPMPPPRANAAVAPAPAGVTEEVLAPPTDGPPL